MIVISEFSPLLEQRLPETHALLRYGGLNLHDAVTRVTLHGSRSLRGRPRPDSDLDLSLVVEPSRLAMARDQAAFLRAVLTTTVQAWRGTIDLDLAAIFDKSDCGLRCLDHESFSPGVCVRDVDCMGLFKIQKGFDGFVPGSLLDVKKMYPLITIWRRQGSEA